jgi:DNA-binding XRE family transcriptional regulator
MGKRMRLVWPTTDDFKNWREELGKSEQQMADLAGISRDEYIEVERTGSAIGVNFLKVCAAFAGLGKQRPPAISPSSLN